MDQSRGSSHALVNLLTLPAELIIYIISFLSSTHDRVKLRYVSKWFRCVTEGTPSLWKEFVWPYYDSHEECSVKEVLKVCGQHIKVLSFPYSRVPSSLVIEMLEYCNNVKHLSLPSSSEELQEIIDHTGHLHILELELVQCIDFKQLLLDTGQLKELSISLDKYDDYFDPRGLCMQWKECTFRPSILKLFTKEINVINVIDCAAELTDIPIGTTASFRVYDRDSKIPLTFSPLFPCFQLQIEASGQVTTPCVKPSDFGILGLENDLAVMTDCQYGGRTMYMVKYYRNQIVISDIMYIVKLCDLTCATDFDFSCYYSLRSGHLEQLAIACPNLQRLNLDCCCDCLSSLQGLQAIASHCPYLEGLNIGIVCVSNIEDRILLWKILSGMKLIHIAAEFCVFRSKADDTKLSDLFQKCWSIREIQLSNCYNCKFSANEDVSILSCFPSLHYCYFEDVENPHLVQDMINNCKKLKYFSYLCRDFELSLSLAHSRNLQQLYIATSFADVPDEFMTSVSAHGSLVHVFMKVRSLKVDGITSLVENSPKLITLYLNAETFIGLDTESFSETLSTSFCKRKLFAVGRYVLSDDWDDIEDIELREGTNLLPLWN